MASFAAFLEVGGKRYPLYRYGLSVYQETDELGRPASPVHGGAIVCTLAATGQQDSFLTQWMLHPEMQHDGKVRLIDPESGATMKTISFFNAYCVRMDFSFLPGLGNTLGSNGRPSSTMQVQINPQRVAVGPIIHDNNWPVASHGSGESFVRQPIDLPKPNRVIAVSQTFSENPASIPLLVTVASATPPGSASQSTCPPAVQAQLQAEVERRCKTGSKTSCSKTDSCEVLVSKMDSINGCIQARTKINMQCYKGGDPGHKIAIQYQINSLVICQGIFFPKCMNPPAPVPQPVPTPESNDDFMRRMEQLTGLSGAALILYLILSEGSRLFPPRNLVPIP
jgi:Hemolysin coregulated protein Hcp (TssD)/Novel toxin 16